MFKQEKGVTLVALVITIIVLLILAGVSISMVAGDNGVLTKASKSSKKTKYGATVEAVNLACADLQSEYVDALSSGNAGGMGTYYTENEMVNALAKQGYVIAKEGATAEADYTELTYTEPTEGTAATPLAAYTTAADKATTKKYRVYAKGAPKDYVQLIFAVKSMGYSPEYDENKLGGSDVNS